MALKIVFFGLPLAALLLEKDGHEIALAAFCRTDSLGLRRAKKVFGGRALVKPDATAQAFGERVEQLAPDLVVSWFWTKRLPMKVLRAARFGGIGAHPSLLPRHRGPDPTYWSIASGDTETGVTVHSLEEHYDTGHILAVERLAIDPSWNSWQLARALDRPSLRLLRSTAATFAKGDVIAPVPQDETLATLAPFPNDEECALVWKNDTSSILRQIRALSPAPGAWTEIAETQITILSAAEATEFPKVLVPGEAIWEHGQALVRTGDSAVRLLRIEIDGCEAPVDALKVLLSAARPTAE